MQLDSVFYFLCDIFQLKRYDVIKNFHEVCLSLDHNVHLETKEQGEKDTECQYWLLKLSAFRFFVVIYFLG